MLKETIICEEPVAAGGARILPVVKVSLSYSQTRGSLSFNVVKQPEYVIVYYAGKATLYDMSGDEIIFSQAKLDHPGLELILAKYPDFPLPPD